MDILYANKYHKAAESIQADCNSNMLLNKVNQNLLAVCPR